MNPWANFNATELQHLVAALARSPLAHHAVTQKLTDGASDELDRQLEQALASDTIRYNAAAA